MTRRLTILGLVLSGLFVMSAVAAVAASAQQGVLTTREPRLLTGQDTGEKPTG